MRTAIAGVLVLAFGASGWAAPVHFASGTTTLGPPDADGTVLASVDFGTTFDPNLFLGTMPGDPRLLFDLTIQLGPDVFDSGEAFGLFSVPTGGGIIFFDVPALRGTLLSVLSPSLIAGTKALSPGETIAASDGLFAFEIIPFVVTDRSRGFPDGVDPAPVMDISSFAVDLLIDERPEPPPEPPMPAPEPPVVLLLALGTLVIAWRQRQTVA